MPAGLASLVLQSQAFFTVLIAALLLGEGVHRHNIVGMGVAVLGLVLIKQGAAAGFMTLLGFMLTLLAALSWSTGHFVAMVARRVDMLGLLIAGVLLPTLHFLALSWFLTVPKALHDITTSLHSLGI